MTVAIVFANVLDRSGDRLGEFLPRIGAALAILIVGLVVVRILCRLLTRMLIAVGGDRLAERLHVHDTLARLGLERSLSRVVVALVRVLATIAVVLVALSTLGLRTVDEALNQALLFLPRLLVAVAIVVVGVGLAGAARERADRLAYQMDLRGPVGTVVSVAVMAIAAILALGQVGVSTTILVVLAGLVVGGVALTVALAFGGGNQALAGELSAGRYTAAAFKEGDRITVDGTQGEITALQATFVLLETAEGTTVVVPNSRLMAQTVEVHPAAEETSA